VEEGSSFTFLNLEQLCISEHNYNVLSKYLKIFPVRNIHVSGRLLLICNDAAFKSLSKLLMELDKANQIAVIKLALA